MKFIIVPVTLYLGTKNEIDIVTRLQLKNISSIMSYRFDGRINLKN